MNKKAKRNNIQFNKIMTVVAVILVTLISSCVLYFRWNSKTKADYYQEYIESGKEYMENGYYVEAIYQFKEAELIRSDENVQVAMAECYLGLNDYTTFKTNAEQIQKVYGTNEKLYQDLAYYYRYMNDSYSEIHTLMEGKEAFPECEELSAKYNQVKGSYTQAGLSVDQVPSVGDSYMIVKVEDKEQLVSSTLSEVGDMNYDRVFDISTDSCIAAKWKDTEMLYSAMVNGRIDYYDSKGYKRSSPEKSYMYLGAPRDGYALIQTDEGWSYIDQGFNELGIWFEDATAFSGGIAAVKKDGKWAFINTNFEKITDHVYEEVVYDEFKCCSNGGVAFAKKKGSYVLIDAGGEQEGGKGYSLVKPFASGEDFAAVKQDGKWQLIDTKGNVIQVIECDELCSSMNGIAAVKQDGKWGYIGVCDGEYVEAMYQGVSDVNMDGYGAVMLDDKWTFIHFTRFEYNQGL